MTRLPLAAGANVLKCGDKKEVHIEVTLFAETSEMRDSLGIIPAEAAPVLHTSIAMPCMPYATSEEAVSFTFLDVDQSVQCASHS